MVSPLACRAPALFLCLMLTALSPVRAYAQSVEPALLDPETPMAPMADIGVDWPEMSDDPVAPLPDAQTPVAANSDSLRYTIVLAGIEGDARAAIAPRFDALSTLRSDEKNPANAAQINRRARDDSELLVTLLKNYGYYDAVVDPEIERQSADVLIVRLTAEPGVLYSFASVDVTGLETTGEKAADFRKAFGVTERDPVNVDTVVAARDALSARIKREGLPFARIGEPKIVVDHDTQTATLSMSVDPGGARTIGKFLMIGNRAPFGADHVRDIARFKSGDMFNQAGIDDLKRALIATGLASSVTVSPVPGESDDIADIAVSLEPAPTHTIAGELGYGTGEGIRVNASWTDRNLIRPEGAVTLRGVLGTREQSLGGVLRQGNFRKRDQVLNARLGVSRSNFRAFQASSFDIAAGIERQSNIIWQKKWTWSAGLELIATDERDVVGAGISRRRTFFVGAAPLTLNYDGSNDLLDPTRGFRIGVRASPEVSLQNGTFGYVRTQFDASYYQPASDRITIAGRIRLGSIQGAKSDAIAPSRRFYAGGGGSVRGYGFQQIGPRDIANDPDGGRSLAEIALEARIRIGPFGVVPFVDAGNIYSKTYPDFSGLRYGAGIGARYHSSFGPIRIDVGTPINRQAGDARVTVFVSLGQAF